MDLLLRLAGGFAAAVLGHVSTAVWIVAGCCALVAARHLPRRGPRPTARPRCPICRLDFEVRYLLRGSRVFWYCYRCDHEVAECPQPGD